MEWLKKIHNYGQKIAGPNEWRRRTRRVTVWGMIEVQVGKKIISMPLRNATPTSVGIVCRRRLPIGYILVRPAFSQEWHRMRVVHSTSTIGGYKIGLNMYTKIV